MPHQYSPPGHALAAEVSRSSLSRYDHSTSFTSNVRSLAHQKRQNCGTELQPPASDTRSNEVRYPQRPSTRHVHSKATDWRPPPQHPSLAGARCVTHYHHQSFPNTAFESPTARAVDTHLPPRPRSRHHSCQALPLQ
ncbi:hypothetical protein E2C01_066512 [Portunus trituberculatus]|uniref:Uncharacterized protein n=1 Tax=Portunus trituberculatus TaxID=210409 RepID=A0A5B7HUV8_PORTR|nr:hypothetical protein [Portunus trituberculatus]